MKSKRKAPLPGTLEVNEHRDIGKKSDHEVDQFSIIYTPLDIVTVDPRIPDAFPIYSVKCPQRFTGLQYQIRIERGKLHNLPKGQVWKSPAQLIALRKPIRTPNQVSNEHVEACDQSSNI